MAEPGCGRARPHLVIDAEPFIRGGALLAAILVDHVSRAARVRLAIPGGSALEAVEIAHGRLGESWRHVELTWVDERCVPVEDVASNRGAATRAGLCGSARARTPMVGPRSVLPLYADGETPDEAVRRVERAFVSHFDQALDVAVLGMGSDGHVASLFPTRSMPVDGFVASVADSPKPPASRITLTRAALATAASILIVVSGESKREALQRLVDGDASLPAAGLAGVTVVTDLDLDRDRK